MNEESRDIINYRLKLGGFDGGRTEGSRQGPIARCWARRLSLGRWMDGSWNDWRLMKPGRRR